MKRLLLAVLLCSSARAAPGGTVVGSKHDLSVNGPGPIRAVSETNPCLFCHISHAGRSGSNRPDSRAVYLPYESSTMSAKPGSPTGASRVCLSCHDGTIAVGRTLARDIPTVGGTIAPGGSAHIGTDLRSSHPISFAPGASQKTRRPHPGDAVKYDVAGQVQCTSCHDPHKEYGDPQLGKFLVKPSARSQLCLSCHDELQTSAPASSHANAAASFGANEGNTSGRSTVGEAGCAACHPSHHGDGKGRLLNRPAGDDDALCLRCHSGTVARRNVSADLSKRSAHVSRDRGVHDAAEGRPGALQKLPESSPAARRHVSCVDCHDPHRASDRPASAAAPAGALDGVWGVDRNGQRVEQVRFEYEVCLKCHGDSTNHPLPNPTGPRRAASDPNLRLVFAADAASAHPVVTPGRGVPSPSLKPSWTPGSTIACGDCHASDSGPGAGGAGPRGPHGSSFPYLLERSYQTADFTPESPAAYALCYKCHDRAVLLSEQLSSFPEHKRHLGGTVAAPCSACHTAHGVSARRASATGANAHLVDFDTSIVKGSAAGLRRYASTGAASGSCTLTCHGKEHTEAQYFPGSTQPAPPLPGVRAVRSVRTVKFR